MRRLRPPRGSRRDSLVLPAAANASPYIRYGVQDDAWLEFGPGTLDSRLDQLDALGVDVVRVTVDWRAD